LDYENALLGLLAELEGLTAGRLRGFLMMRGLKPEGLAQWLRSSGMEGLSRSQNGEVLARGLRGLALVATGELAEAAIAVARGLEGVGSVGETQAEEDFSVSEGELSDEAWLEKGNSLFGLGRYEEAITSWDRAIEIKPDDDEAWFNRGFALVNLGEYEKAIASYDRAIEIKPDFHQGWNNRGVALKNLGEYEKAIASYDRALEIKPDKHEAWYNRGFALRNLGENEKAIASYDRALEIKPDKHEAWNNRGIALENLGEYERAIASYDRAIEIKPDYHQGWNNRGIALGNLGENEKAIASYDRALEIKPDGHEAWYNRGIALRNLGENERAIASYDRALTLTQGKFWEAWQSRSAAAIQSTGRGSKNPLFAYSLTPALNHPDLDLRGYPGQLACLREGLKYIQRETDPEGWGQLHRFTGRAHYDHARYQKNPTPYWEKAARSYQTALETLTRDLPIPHLETLQDLIRVLTALQETEQAQTLLRDGTAFLTRHLTDKSEAARKRLEPRFKPIFNELTIALAVQSGDYSHALVIAEQDKNALLRKSLLANRPATSPDYPQIQTFLQTQPHSAILYWHHSANALTTFLLLPDRPDPIALTTELSQLLQLETWIKTWKTDYQTHRTQKTEKSPPFEGGLGGSWRDRLPQNLAALQTLLSIPAIENHLSQLPQCDRLILIPHRDLHLLPLDSLFDPQYSISYLPSLQIGINLQTRLPQPSDRLLSIENPDSIQKESDGSVKTFPALTAAEAESELICQKYSAATRRDKSQTTFDEVSDQLRQPHTILHFTGHGYYDYSQPLNSALALSQQDRLTLTDIVALDLSTYELTCLCACETAIAANQTITTEYIGIVSAFMYANVGKVISTLWTVESVASAILMVEFHRRRLAGTPTAQSLHQAKQWLKKATPTDLQTWYQETLDSLPPDHSLIPWLRARQRENAKIEPDHQPYQNPYYWAAFTLTGL
jgi:tetratricopeptide (TPR) repeat protein